MKESERVSFGIVGCGKHASRVLFPAFKETRYAQLRGAARPAAEEEKLLAQLHPLAACFKSNEALLESPDIEAVCIGLPNHLHATWTLKALSAGKHVLCEKPFALDEREAAIVREQATASGRLALEAFMYRFHPLNRQVRTMLKDGVIGDIRLFETHFHYSLEKNDDDIRLNPQKGGGGLLDVGCYLVDCSRYLLDKEPCRVAATHVAGPSGVDTSLSAQLVYKDGAAAHFTCGCSLPRANFYVLYGTKGVIRVPQAYHIPRGKKGFIEIEYEAGRKRRIEVPPANHYVLELEYFAQRVLGCKVEPGLMEDGVANMKIIAAIKAAAESGRSVVIEGA